jgi:hypothetical protein
VKTNTPGYQALADHEKSQLEGIFTIIAGIVFTSLFPGLPSNPVSLAGVSYFSEKEITILQNRVYLDDPSKAVQKSHVEFSVVLKTVRHPYSPRCIDISEDNKTNCCISSRMSNYGSTSCLQLSA